MSNPYTPKKRPGRPKKDETFEELLPVVEQDAFPSISNLEMGFLALDRLRGEGEQVLLSLSERALAFYEQGVDDSWPADANLHPIWAYYLCQHGLAYQFFQQKGEQNLQSFFAFLVHRQKISFTSAPTRGDILFSESRGLLVGAHLVKSVQMTELPPIELSPQPSAYNTADKVEAQLQNRPLYTYQVQTATRKLNRYSYEVSVYGKEETLSTWYALAHLAQ